MKTIFKLKEVVVEEAFDRSEQRIFASVEFFTKEHESYDDAVKSLEQILIDLADSANQDREFVIKKIFKP